MLRICHAGGDPGLVLSNRAPFNCVDTHWVLSAVLYFMLIIYLFMGVNVVADYFMQSIEMITSQRKKVRNPQTGQVRLVMLWNDTVANLTLLALGSSAPEILLSLIDAIASGFFSGELGPGTIVGSAAFNLLVIVPVCMLGIPCTEVRKINQTTVYTITLVFSIFAYFWLLLIVSVITPDVIDVWEGLVTLFWMPILVVISYLADIGVINFFGKKEDETPLLGGAGLTEEDKEHIVPPKARLSLERLAKSLEHAKAKMQEDENAASTQRVSIDRLPSNKAGVLTFAADSIDIPMGQDQITYPVPLYRRIGTNGQITCKYRTERHTAVPGMDYVDSKGSVVFKHGEDTKDIELTLLGKRPTEKTDNFLLIVECADEGITLDPTANGAPDALILTVNLINFQREQSMPTNAVTKAIVNVREMLADKDLCALGCMLWKEQILSAFTMGDDDEDEEEEPGEETGSDAGDKQIKVNDGGGPSIVDKVLWVIGMPWDVFFAVFSPPAIFGGGWALFSVAILHIAIMSSLICDTASLLGCVLNVEDIVVALTVVALGTSLPDMFASFTAAQKDEYADASVVNVTGSNSVNVFLGIGVPWTVCCFYWWSVGATDKWKSKYGNMGFAEGSFIVLGKTQLPLPFVVILFSTVAVIAFVMMRFKRIYVGGELGGERKWNYGVAFGMIGLWVAYIIICCTCTGDKGSPARDALFNVCIVFLVLTMIAAVGMEVAVCKGMVIPVEDQEDSDVKEEPSAGNKVEPQRSSKDPVTIVIGPIRLKKQHSSGEDEQALVDALIAVRDGSRAEGLASEYCAYYTDASGRPSPLDHRGRRGEPYFLREVFASEVVQREHGEKSRALNKFREFKSKYADYKNPLSPVMIPTADINKGVLREDDFIRREMTGPSTPIKGMSNVLSNTPQKGNLEGEIVGKAVEGSLDAIKLVDTGDKKKGRRWGNEGRSDSMLEKREGEDGFDMGLSASQKVRPKRRSSRKKAGASTTAKVDEADAAPEAASNPETEIALPETAARSPQGSVVVDETLSPALKEDPVPSSPESPAEGSLAPPSPDPAAADPGFPPA
eukprot:TRINITY_DN3365_c0_g1_i1.p1 TRINITY_DN3365_c0_g1~~TRINITY_DN3365_c0_g1_i1.p1  ORF type:complete len:1065 (+),score=261.96 TRINITY_DN3365_c0_g1_i1:223-3417(+)